MSAIPVPNPTQRNLGEHTLLIKGDIPNPVNPPSGCVFHPRCPYATSLCKQEEPVFEEKEPGHFVACHYPLNEGKGVIYPREGKHHGDVHFESQK